MPGAVPQIKSFSVSILYAAADLPRQEKKPPNGGNFRLRPTWVSGSFNRSLADLNAPAPRSLNQPFLSSADDLQRQLSF
ncbi:MAG: hypothetical protein N2595_06290 [bacterium]|nr:hypothetical protein [bacterium]